MAVEFSEGDGPVFLEFEVHAPMSRDHLTDIVENLDDDHVIQKIAIEVAAENPAAISLPSFLSNDTPAEDFVEQNEQSDKKIAANDDIPKLQTSGDPFAIMRTLWEADDWIRTRELKEIIPEESDVSKDAIGANLWNLADRGLVEKRSYEADKRQKEYRITATGETALQEALRNLEE